MNTNFHNVSSVAKRLATQKCQRIIHSWMARQLFPTFSSPHLAFPAENTGARRKSADTGMNENPRVLRNGWCGRPRHGRRVALSQSVVNTAGKYNARAQQENTAKIQSGIDTSYESAVLRTACLKLRGQEHRKRGEKNIVEVEISIIRWASGKKETPTGSSFLAICFYSFYFRPVSILKPAYVF